MRKQSLSLAIFTMLSGNLLFIGSKTALSVGYFENHFDDAITFLPGTPGTYINLSEDPSKGWEVELRQDLSTHWQLHSTFTHLTEKPETSFREADNLASLMLNYHDSQWNMNVALEYTAEREMLTSSDTFRLKVDSYWLLRAKILYEIDSKWTLALEGKNLLNQDYETPPVSTNLLQGIPNKRRYIELGIKYNF